MSICSRWITAAAAILTTLAGCATNHGSARTKQPAPSPSASAGSHIDHPTAHPNWWADARFGMFIHWGLYAVPAGVWGDRTDHGEWIRESAKIPVGEYEKLKEKFNPAHFDADAIVLAAKNAGMKYIVITSKHHDGFGLFDSKLTHWDVMSTPFRRDIMKEMSDACARHGITMCWYHSIMDWHHPDYTPRRPWERAARPETGADMDRYVAYMKGQLKELLTNYGPIGLLWFDGQWEGTWNDARGRDLAQYVRSLQPGIIINSRVGRSEGAWNSSGDDAMIGDYATPEQTIPAAAIRNVPWETCMTMNDHWGYNAADKNFKSAADLIHKLADIASKGGNFLLNVGPDADGRIPPESLARLAEIGRWMKANGESIYQTQAGPYDAPLAWGCITQRTLDASTTRLYLHVSQWPQNGEIVLPGLLNPSAKASLLTDASSAALAVDRRGEDMIVHVSGAAPDATDTVVVLDLPSAPDLSVPPTIAADADIFVDAIEARLASDRPGVTIHYTVDGSEPTAGSPVAASPVRMTQTSTVAARAFRGQTPVSPVVRRTFTKVAPTPATIEGLTFGVDCEYFEGAFKSVSELGGMTAISKSVVNEFKITPHAAIDNWGYRFRGYIRIPTDGVYTFYTTSDDGSRLNIGGAIVVDNDGPHSASEKSGRVALGAGWHPIEVTYFENTGGTELVVSWSGPGFAKQPIPARSLARKP